MTGAVGVPGAPQGYSQAIIRPPHQPALGQLAVEGAVFLFLDDSISFEGKFRDGETAQMGRALAEISGSLGSILKAERVALNLFQRMCGIATLTRSYVDAVRGTRAVIVDTRKTVPGLRALDKYSVRVDKGTGQG